jgi:hypothetical protein
VHEVVRGRRKCLNDGGVEQELHGPNLLLCDRTQSAVPTVVPQEVIIRSEGCSFKECAGQQLLVTLMLDGGCAWE